MDQKISFRQLRQGDLTLTHQWLIADHVFAWYQSHKIRPTLEEVKQKYLPRILSESPTQCYIILFDGKPIGQIQMYKIKDYPDYQKLIGVNDDVAGIDLFIGEQDFLHKGFGGVIIRKFLKDFVFAKLKVDSCVLGPSPSNTAAIKAYQKAGFVHYKTVLNPEENEEEYLMKITKNGFNQMNVL